MRFESKEAAETALREWAATNARRDQMVTSAREVGVSKNRIHTLTGIARTTIDRILEDTMTAPVSHEDVVAWLGDNHGLTEEGISALVEKAAEIGREWPVADLHRGARLDRLWWTYQDIVEAAASSKDEALATIHGKGRTGVDPWKPGHDERA